MNLSELAGKSRDVELKPVTERHGAIVAYRRILIELIREIQRETRDSVLPEFQAAITLDDESSWFERMKRVAELGVTVAIGKVRRLFTDESQSHLQRLALSVERGIGIDVSPMLNLSQAEEVQLVELYVNRNASLIKSLSDDTVKRVEQAVYDARLNRLTYKDLQVTLREQFGIAQSRAELIAYDQLASLNTDFTRSRHNALGIETYRWRTRHDSRVRPLHRSLNGQEFKWGEPTGAEGGLPPGKNIRCRCTAVALIPAATAASAERNRRTRENLAESNAEATRRDRATNRRRAVS